MTNGKCLQKVNNRLHCSVHKLRSKVVGKSMFKLTKLEILVVKRRGDGATNSENCLCKNLSILCTSELTTNVTNFEKSKVKNCCFNLLFLHYMHT